MKTYVKTNVHLKHVNSWFRAMEDHKEELRITEIYFENDSPGLVRCAKGLVKSEAVIKVGNRLSKAPCMVLATWSYVGKCTDWKGRRLPQYDLIINETAEQRRESIEEWTLTNQSTEGAAHDTKK